MAIRQQTNNAGSPRLNVEPKTIVAVLLIAVMGLLWVRVIFRGKTGPAAASAQSAAVDQQQTQQQPPLQIYPVRLEIIPGRNDRLSRDLFTPSDGTALAGEAKKTGKVEVDQARLTIEAQQRTAGQIQNSLTLEAIIQDASGRAAKAFIDGRLVETGSTFICRQAGQGFELAVKKVEDTRVILTWQGYEIVLKMPKIDTGDH